MTTTVINICQLEINGFFLISKNEINLLLNSFNLKAI
jgi:hypothetical protein